MLTGTDLARDLARGRLRIPLTTLRGWLPESSDSLRLHVEQAPGGLRLWGSAIALGAPIRFSLRICPLDVEQAAGSLRVRVRVKDVSLQTTEDAPGPLAASIRSGGIGISRPADLLGGLLGLPAFLVEAAGDTIVVDPLRVAALDSDRGSVAGEDRRAQLEVALALVSVRDICVEDDAVQVRFALLPGGAAGLARAVFKHSLLPTMQSWAQSSGSKT